MIPPPSPGFPLAATGIALPAVAAWLDKATVQAQDYDQTLRIRHGLAHLRSFAVVALGVEPLMWREL